MGGFPLDSWSATSVHIARGNMRLDLKILLDLGARALASPNRAPPLKRSLCEKQRTATLPSLAALASGSFSLYRALLAPSLCWRFISALAGADRFGAVRYEAGTAQADNQDRDVDLYHWSSAKFEATWRDTLSVLVARGRAQVGVQSAKTDWSRRILDFQYMDYDDQAAHHA